MSPLCITLLYIASLKTIVGDSHVLTEASDTVRFRQGFRFGKGSAVAVVCPGSLLEQWRVVKVWVAADLIVIMQAANTGLTGGSTSDGGYDREVVMVSTLRVRTVQVVEQGRHPGVGKTSKCRHWQSEA